jgi:hypothetical protein
VAEHFSTSIVSDEGSAERLRSKISQLQLALADEVIFVEVNDNRGL